MNHEQWVFIFGIVIGLIFALFLYGAYFITHILGEIRINMSVPNKETYRIIFDRGECFNKIKESKYVIFSVNKKDPPTQN